MSGISAPRFRSTGGLDAARRLGARRCRKLALIVAALLMLATTPVASQTAAQAAAALLLVTTVDQNAIMRQYAPPLVRPPTLGGRLSLPVAGIPDERLADTRFTLRAVDLEGVVTLD